MLRIGVLASGGGTNLQAIIDATERKLIDAEIALVLSDRASAFALERARGHSIPTAVVSRKEFPVREAFDARTAVILKEHGVELVVLAGYMRLVSGTLLNAFPMRVINIHPALLPSFPGLDVQRAAIEHGARFSGCTVHFVDSGLDSGPIIIQAAVPILQGDTPETLAARILREEHRILPQAIQYVAQGRVSVEGRRVTIAGAEYGAGGMVNPRLEIF